jgi:hypothetical protein
MAKFTYTVFIDNLATGTTEDIDLPDGSDLLSAVDLAVAKSRLHDYYNAAIRVAAYMAGSEDAKLVWANEVAYKRNIAFV